MKILAWGLVAAWGLLLVTLTHMSRPPGVLVTSHDKTLHFIAYSTLGFLVYIASAAQWPRRGALPLILVLLGAVFAATDEITQPYFGRTADVLDFQADMIGLIVGVSVGAVVRRVSRRWLGTNNTIAI
jgi:VanZ family protein